MEVTAPASFYIDIDIDILYYIDILILLYYIDIDIFIWIITRQQRQM